MSTITNATKEEKRFVVRGAWWINVLFVGFALLVAYWLLNLVIGGNCDGNCVIGTLSQTLRNATPIAFAALTGLLCERSGIVNIGIEGQMLTGAMVGYAVNVYSYQALLHSMEVSAAGDLSRMLGLVAGVLSSVLLGLLLALVSIKYKTDQVIGGTVINILATGMTGYFYRQFLAENVPPGPGTFPIIPIPGLSQIPVIGPILFTQKPLTYVMLLLVIFVNYMLFFTPWGLRVRSVGEHPRAADTLGINVNRTRYISVILGSIVAGLGGVWFTLEAVDVFSPNMTNGLGFIGLAAMIFGKWNPFGALLGALIFGLGNSVTSTVSIFRPDIPSQIPQMLPYILTIIVLTGVVGRAVPPAAENTPYEKQ
jgi:simple sugar transport system permease protein